MGAAFGAAAAPGQPSAGFGFVNAGQAATPAPAPAPPVDLLNMNWGNK
jgi:hypothetical protein